MNLKEIAKEIRTQDNMITANPIFILFELEKIPTLEDYAENTEYAWIEGEYTPMGKTKEEVIKKCKEWDLDLPDNIADMNDYDFDSWIDDMDFMYKHQYIEVKSYRQAFFTKKSLEEHLKANKHHYKNPHISCVSLWRNPEMNAIRDALMENRFTELEEKEV